VPNLRIILAEIISSAETRVYFYHTAYCGPGSSVGIATVYELDGPGSILVGTKFSARPDRPWGPPSLL